MCISWTIEGLISLMHGVTMKIKFEILNFDRYACRIKVLPPPPSGKNRTGGRFGTEYQQACPEEITRLKRIFLTLHIM